MNPEENLNLKMRAVDDNMRIMTTSNGYVDLEAPIQMTENQRRRFIEFFQQMFPEDVNVQDKEEKKGHAPGGGKGAKRWQIDEYAELLGPKTNEELANELDRSVMGVKMHRGFFVSNFRGWLKSKGLAIQVDHELIAEYLSQGGDHE